MDTAYNFGNKWNLAFFHDYTKKFSIYFLKVDKSQPFETFKNFHLYIGNAAKSSISLWLDNGVGSSSNYFQSYLL